MRPEDYIVPVNDQDMCGLCVQYVKGQDIGYFILGDAFLRDWYAIHTYQPLRLGFVPHADSNRVKPVKAEVIYADSGDTSGYISSGISQKAIVQIAMSLSGLILVALILLIIFCPALLSQRF